ncbi:MAG: hypothetical protein Q9225_002269 [Loekoesia sp. 1 TL-2023]
MSSAALQKLNALLVGNSRPFGTFTFGVVPDNDYVPDLPSRLLRQGKFDRTLSVMIGHNQDEGSMFIQNTVVTSDSSYVAYLKSLIMPLADDIGALDRVTQVLYPPIYDGSKGYRNQVERNNLTVADAIFVCNARAMHQADDVPQTYAYVFSGPPALHGDDLVYTFYDSGPASGINTTVAEIMQRYITQFAETGDPNAPDLPQFPAARPTATVQNLGSDFVGPSQDEGGMQQLEERCQFWQDAPYLTKYR